MDRPHRGTLFLEDARVVALQAFPGHQYVLRLEAPRCAGRATPGSFVHLQCAADVPMRRPLSIMSADPAGGTIEVLFKVVGEGLRALARSEPGSSLSVLGPIGRGFSPDPKRPRTVLIGGGVGMPPLRFLATRLAGAGAGWKPLACFGSEIPFPFRPARAASPLHGIDHRIDACDPLLEAAGVPSRLASLAGFDGCHRGHVTALAADCLAGMHAADRDEVAIFACGPQAMLRAAAGLARDFGVPAELCLEEYMACGVGGCAGCAVRVQTPDGAAMKRVCVDGPVFDARAVYPELFAGDS